MTNWVGEDRKVKDIEIAREAGALGFTPDDFWKHVDPTGERDWYKNPVMVSELYDWTIFVRERLEECQTYRDYEDEYYAAT